MIRAEEMPIIAAAVVPMLAVSCGAGVGLDPMVEATAAEDLAPDAFLHWLRTRHGIGLAGGLNRPLCAGYVRLSILRSHTAQNLPLGSITVPDRHLVLHRRPVAAWLIALARARKRIRDSGVLDRRRQR
jgi:hypothetical protein